MNLVRGFHKHVMKKAVNITGKLGGDDGFQDRLLSYLNQNLPYQIVRLTPLRRNVFIVRLSDGFQFVLKGYSSLRRLKIQEAFIQSLKKEGFPFTYSMYSFPKEHCLYFESQYFGIFEFLTKGEEPFFYDSKKSCQEGLQLLEKFHGVSEKLVGSYKTLLPFFHLIEKWEERFRQFKSNIPILSFFLQKEVVQDLSDWAEWSLAGIKQEKGALHLFPNVILHGDVAHHNFFRSSNGELLLIDFDLISIAPAMIDYLQYANRILPFLNWSCKELSSFEQLLPYFKHTIFLYALVYPTDIFREWNRLVKDHSFNDTRKVRAVMELTIGQYDKRQAFYEEIKTRITNGGN